MYFYLYICTYNILCMYLTVNYVLYVCMSYILYVWHSMYVHTYIHILLFTTFLSINCNIFGTHTHAHTHTHTHTLQPENIVLVDAGNRKIKIVDFGCARDVSSEAQTQTLGGTAEFVGTFIYVCTVPLTGNKRMFSSCVMLTLFTKNGKGIR